MIVRIGKRDNLPEDRLVENESLECRYDDDSEGQSVSLDVVAEIYCEVGELAQFGYAPARGCDDTTE